MSEQTNSGSFLERTVESDRAGKIRRHAALVGKTVAFVISFAVLILEVVFRDSLVLGFGCLGICFITNAVEKILTYFSLKSQNELFTGLAELAAFAACVLFVVLAIL